jgi:hypothetical protein
MYGMKPLILLLLLGFQSLAQPQSKPDRQKEMLKGKVKPNNYDIDSFSESGYRVKTYHVDSGSVAWVIEYNYNDNNMLTEKIQTAKDVTRTSYTYDAGLKRMEQVNYKADGTVGTRVYSTYDKNGNMTEQRSIGIIKNKCLVQNDAAGRPIEMFCFGPDENLENKLVFTYDPKGRKLSAGNYNPEGKLFDKTLYQYDMNDNEIELRSLDSNEHPREVILTRYQYDNQGNWITMVKTDENGTVKTTAKREIYYY